MSLPKANNINLYFKGRFFLLIYRNNWKISKYLKKNKSDYIFISAPENVAWTLNIRGGDSPNSPIPNSKLIISKSKKILLISNLKKCKKLLKNKTIKKDKERTFDGAEHITLKMDERTKNGWTRIPEVFDEDGNYFAEPIGNGSKMDIFVSIGESSFGPHLKLGQLTDMDRDKKTLSFALGRMVDLVYYESAEATQLKAAAEKSDNKEMEVALEDF